MKSVPVKEGDVLDVKIEAIGDKGDGIAKIQGFICFVKANSLMIGDEIRVRVSRVKQRYAFSEEVMPETT